MPVPLTTWPESRDELLNLGWRRVVEFCQANSIRVPELMAESKEEWHFDSVCAYYRPETIHICVDKCAQVAQEAPSRNWNWPGSTVDREPYGVLAHELGHHCDWLTGERKGHYYSDYSILIRKLSGEPALSGYCDNDAEWFAEMFRVFVTNPGLVEKVRPKTFKLLIERWKPVGSLDWRWVLGRNVPDRVVTSLRNKFKGGT